MVTGTLDAGRLAVGDELRLRDRGVHIRGLQSLEVVRHQVDAVARIAVNLRGIGSDEIGRGDALLTPGSWRPTTRLDVRRTQDGLAGRDGLDGRGGQASWTGWAGSCQAISVLTSVRPLSPSGSGASTTSCTG